MPKYAALLRGITPTNPNMRNEKLRGLFEDLCFTNVQTVISTGNVIFESDAGDSRALEDKIEAALPERLGFTSTVIIRSQAELQQLIGHNPFGDATHGPQTSLTVTFLKHEPASPISFTFPYSPPGKAFQLVGMHDRAVFAIADTTATKTPDLMAWLERTFGKEITTRTWLTVERVVKKL